MHKFVLGGNTKCFFKLVGKLYDVRFLISAKLRKKKITQEIEYWHRKSSQHKARQKKVILHFWEYASNYVSVCSLFSIVAEILYLVFKQRFSAKKIRPKVCKEMKTWQRTFLHKLHPNLKDF